MSLPEQKHTGYTVSDWEDWEGRWELIDGVAYDMTPAPNVEHQRISMKFAVTISNALDDVKCKTGAGKCEVFAAPIDVYLSDNTVVQPDLLVVCDPSKVSYRGIEGAPDLIVEILSPATARRDLTWKKWTYEAAGVPEYLIVDPEEKWGLIFRLEKGKYQEQPRLEWSSIISILGGKLSVVLTQ